MKNTWLIFSILLVYGAFSLSGYSSELLADGKGAITGTVIDSQGAVIPDVKVVVINENTGQTFSTTTQADGQFSVQSVPFGKYTVEVIKTGFATVERKGVDVAPSQEAHLQIVIFLGSGQSNLGQLKISVKDGTGKPIPGAVISVMNTSGSIIVSDKSDKDGEYTYFPAPAGDYLIHAEAQSGKSSQTQVHLKKAQTKRVKLVIK